jgi:hypothetical protein
MSNTHQQKAAEAAQDFVKYLVVLAVGALGFGLSQLSAMSQAMPLAKWLVVASAAMLAASVFFGILAHGTLVSQIYADKIDLEASPLSAYARTQWMLFFIGVLVLGVAVFITEMLNGTRASSQTVGW